MKKILLTTIIAYIAAFTSFAVDKTEVYKDATFWYSFDTDGSDAKSGNNLALTHVNFKNDPVRGNVAEINQGDTGHMEFSQPAISSETFTIATWFYYKSSNKDWWQVIFEFANNTSNNNFYLSPIFWDKFGAVSENKTTSNWESFNANTALTTNKWLHLAMSFENGSVTLYIDGTPVGTGKFTNTISALNLNKFYLGANPNPGRYYKGLDALYDDFAVFNKVLNQNQIYALAHDTLPSPPKEAPNVFETEDYLSDNWAKGNDADTTYGYFNGSNMNNPASNLIHGIIKGQGRMMIWARVKTDKGIKSAFNIQIDGGSWVPCDSIPPSTKWNWVQIKGIAATDTIHVLNLSPLVKDLKIDKILTTFNWNYNPSKEYQKTDLVAPQTPVNFTVKSVTEYTALLSWNKVKDNDNALSYDIFNNGKIFMVTKDTFARPVLQASTVYNFAIRAKDAAGNISSKTEEIKATTKALEFTADLGTTKQTIHHFGASDAWSVESIGLWPSERRDSLAKLLFSSKFDNNGNPEGVALSNWRFRIGDGSRDQKPLGLASGNWSKTTHCFLGADGEYDWTQQEGSVWFLNKAKEYGVPHFTGWTDSPPYFMTKSGYVFRITNQTNGYNLDPSKYADYADFLAQVTNHFEDQGIHFDVISPVNEPQWGWDYKVGEGGQPGSYCTNDELSALIKAIDKAFVNNSVKSKLLISEAGALDYLYSNVGNSTGNQIFEFWNKNSTNYIGNLPSMSKYVSGHGYFTETSIPATTSSRLALASKLKSTDRELEYWQTEYSLLSDGYSKEKSVMEPIDYSLYIARVIHYDLTIGNCTGWDWWSTFSRPWYEDHKYRFALINWWPNVENITCSDGTFELTKNLWALGNFSHFVRPGYVRINTSRSDFLTADQSGSKQMISAYVSPASDTIVFVVINYAETDQNINLKLSNLPVSSTVGNLKRFVTSANDDLSYYPEIKADSIIPVKARSVTTFVGAIKKEGTVVPSNKEANKSNVEVYPNPVSTQLNIKVSNAIAKKAELFDITGKKMGGFLLNNSATTFDVSKYPEGYYYLSVYYNNKIENKKILIIK